MLNNAALLLPTQRFHVLMMGGNIKNPNALMYPQKTVAWKHENHSAGLEKLTPS